MTVENPEGKKFISRDVPAGATGTLKVDLPTQDTYDFYCDKTAHSTMGMKGRIEVVAP